MIVEDFEGALRRYLTHGGRMESVMEITVPTLHEDGGVTETLCEHFTAHVIEVYSLTDVPTRVLDRGIAVHVGHTTQTKPVRGCVGICEAVDDEAGSRGLEGFTHADVEFVVSDGTPVLWFVIRDGSHV